MNKVNNTKELLKYIEKLRSFRNIDIETFVKDIISVRQYRRYTKGESNVSYKILYDLCGRLNFTPEYVFLEFESEKLREAKKVTAFYNAVVDYNFAAASELMLSLDERHLLDDNNRLLMAHAKNIMNFYTEKISKDDVIMLTKKLIDYDTVISRRAFSSSELLILISLIELDIPKNSKVVADKLVDYVNNQVAIISGHNVRTLVLVLQQLAQYYNLTDNIEEALKCCTLGVEYAHSMRNYFLLDYLYYFLAVIHDRKQNKELYEDSLYNCYLAVNIEQNPAKVKKFNKLIEDHFKINFSAFIKNYINTHIDM